MTETGTRYLIPSLNRSLSFVTTLYTLEESYSKPVIFKSEIFLTENFCATFPKLLTAFHHDI